MLIQRVITALVLLPPVLATLWFGPTPLVGAVFGAVALVAVYEWASLTLRREAGGAVRPSDRAARWVCLAGAAALIGLAIALRHTAFVWVLVLGTCLWWVLMLRWIATYPDGFGEDNPPRWVKAGAALVVVPGTIAAVMLLHGAPGPEHHGPLRLLFAFFLVWAADVGAYFAGRAFGARKLAPAVSPGKTWEGVYGGVALALLIAAVAGQWLFGIRGFDWAPFLLLCVVVVLISIVGDLGESLLKREAGAKDSGTLLPGHGGLLDRIDSLLAALPAMAVGLWALGL
jgi:phosphatidate cytidylyltransferase